MSALSVSSMLNHTATGGTTVSANANANASQRTLTRPAVLDISNLLCPMDDDKKDNGCYAKELFFESPALSPPLTPSPISVSSNHLWPLSEGHNVDPMASSTSLSSVSTVGSIHSNGLPIKKQQRTRLLRDPSVEATPAGQLGHQTEEEDEDEDEGDEEMEPVKAKRKRANAKQLEVLNRVFDRTFFPSTQLRAELGRQLGMSPRTVQIWFQNRRQAIRTREKQRLLRIRDESSASPTSSTE